MRNRYFCGSIFELGRTVHLVAVSIPPDFPNYTRRQLRITNESTRTKEAQGRDH